MRSLRTPDERFTDLPGVDLVPRHADGPDGEGGPLRMARVEGGPAAGVARLSTGLR